MDQKSKIIIALSLIILILVGILAYVVSGEDKKEDVIRSEERVKSLENQLDSLKVYNDTLTAHEKRLEDKLSEKPKERVVIKYNQNEQTNIIVCHTPNESVEYLAERLSEISLN